MNNEREPVLMSTKIILSIISLLLCVSLSACKRHDSESDVGPEPETKLESIASDVPEKGPGEAFFASREESPSPTARKR